MFSNNKRAFRLYVFVAKLQIFEYLRVSEFDVSSM